MTRTNSMLIRWRVQVRKSRTAEWKNRGLWETRDAARASARAYRKNLGHLTRVVRHEGKGK